MTYLRGTLELMSPSILREDVKTILLATFVRPGESQTRLARDYQNALRASP